MGTAWPGGESRGELRGEPRRRAGLTLTLYLLPPAAALLLAILPTASLSKWPEVCPSKRLLNAECPGCGMTRATSRLLHGDPAGAWRLNRGVVIVLPTLAWVWGRGAVRQARAVHRDRRQAP